MVTENMEDMVLVLVMQTEEVDMELVEQFKVDMEEVVLMVAVEVDTMVVMEVDMVQVVVVKVVVIGLEKGDTGVVAPKYTLSMCIGVNRIGVIRNRIRIRIFCHWYSFLITEYE